MADGIVTVLARFKARKGLEREAKQAIMACLAPTRAEPGCINYDLHQSLEDEGTFMLHENWRSKKALDEHLEMPYLKALKAKAPALFAEPIDIALWNKIG